MKILKTAAEAAAWWGDSGAALGLVPTMGNLHAGHIALAEAARGQCERVIASIFVNPLQFGAGEDIETYPRTFDADRAALAAVGVDAVFVPSVETMYPRGASDTIVRVSGLTDILCGAHRPGHFEGVATVVAKLFNMVRPERAFFGEKDYQQLAVIARMAEELCLGVRVLGVPTVREADGLALSSRNQYLNAEQRRCAPALAAALADCVDRLAAGERDFSALTARGLARLTAAGFTPDYFEIRDAQLNPPTATTRDFRVLAAGTLGCARLIDNMGYAPERS
jgi:pantoate--beta-alanine ligase